MKVLVDADIVAYRCAAVNEKADFPLARWQADQLITRIIEDVNASDWKLFLTSGNNNFRYTVYPEYKANRRDQPKPRHLELLREHLVLDWNAELVDGYEADDAIGIELSTNGGIAASIDKDLLQLPGRHFNFITRSFTDVTETAGMAMFFRQLLIGDPTDNIKGCPGIGKVTTERLLRNIETVDGLYITCLKAYEDAFSGESGRAFEQLNLNAQLIYIWRRENDNWQRLLKPPTDSAKQKVEVMSSSSPKTQNISMESTKVPTTNGIPTDGS
jgi:hypothetical protein